MHIVLPHVQIAFLKFTSCDRVYFNCCCSCSFEPEIIKIGQSTHKMYSNNILNFKCLYKKGWKLIEYTTYVYFGSISSFIQISLNIIDIFCLHIFLLILSYCRIDFIVFPKNFLPDFGPSWGEGVLQKWCNFCMYITTL